MKASLHREAEFFIRFQHLTPTEFLAKLNPIFEAQPFSNERGGSSGNTSESKGCFGYKSTKVTPYLKGCPDVEGCISSFQVTQTTISKFP